MARQGKPRLKVVSSGRLTGGGRGQASKKTVVRRHVMPFEPAYSLYSTDSEDQVTTVHKGLDRCAALLNGILQAETKESTVSKSCLKSHVPKTAFSKTKSNLVSGKLEAERKKLGRKSCSVSNVSRKIVQKTILSSQSSPNSRGQPATVDVVSKPEVTTKRTSATQLEQSQPHYLPLACPGSGGTNIIPSAGLQASTVFNCRLTTSTPTLSPPRPTLAHSQVSQTGSDGQLHYFTQQWDIGTGGQSSQHEAQTHYTASLSVAPAVQQLPGGPTRSVQQATTIPEAKGDVRVPSPLLSAPHMVGSDGSSTPMESCTGSLTCPSPTVATHTPLLHLQAHLQPMLVCDPDPQEQQLSCKESSDECGGCSSEEDELALVDTTPVRDTSCQTSMNNPTAMFNQGKTFSPEKTARKVMTVKYLLGELKTLVANQDSEAVRLISEVEQSISLLPAMVGSTNVQAELALALQPLRSENVQLRRRLRILNQQLLERERAERQARPVDYTLELANLQSLNLTLQTQLSDSRKELGNLQQDNQRLQQALVDKENDLQQSKEQYGLETSRIRLDVIEALAEMRNCQAKLEASEREKIALTWSVQQKEAEITKLEEIIRNLQKSYGRDTDCPLAQADVPEPPCQLTKSVLDLHENQQKETAVTDRVSDTVKTYLQTLEGTNQSSSSHHSDSHLCNLSPPSTDHGSGGIEGCRLHDPKQNSSGDTDVREGGGSDSAFVPLRETVRVQTAAITQKSCAEQTNESRWVDRARGRSGLEYLGLAFEKLGLSSEDLKTLDDNRGVHYLLHADGESSQLKCTNEDTADLSQQSQNDRSCLRVGDESAYTGRKLVFENTLSSCDIKSIASDWSVNSWSTFNTRDEQNFRNGLAALDASIASIQRTLKAELKK